MIGFSVRPFQTHCTLTLFNITEENIILSIRLPLDPKLAPMQLLKMEKVNGYTTRTHSIDHSC